LENGHNILFYCIVFAQIASEETVPHKKLTGEHRQVECDQSPGESSSDPEIHTKKKHTNRDHNLGRGIKRKFVEEAAGKGKKRRLDYDTFLWVENAKDVIKQSNSDSKGKTVVILVENKIKSVAIEYGFYTPVFIRDIS
jgi:hypothetical protein